jgi:hypothetical protein
VVFLLLIPSVMGGMLVPLGHCDYFRTQQK